MRHTIIIFASFLLLIFSACGSSHETASSKSSGKSARERTLEIDCAMIEAKMQQEIGNTQEAARRYQKIIKADPTYSAAYYELATIMGEREWMDSSLFYAKKAQALDPNNIWYRLLLTEIYENTEDYANLVDAWKGVIAKQPNNIDYYYELSNAYIGNNQIEKAISTLDEVEKTIGPTEEVSLQKKKLWEYLNKPDKAFAEVEKLHTTFPNNTRYTALLAEYYMSKKDFAKAKTYYDDILRSNADDEYIHISLANYYFKTNNNEQGYHELCRGLESPSLDCKSKLDIVGSTYSFIEDIEDDSLTLMSLAKVLEKSCAGSADFEHFYGILLFQNELYDESAKHLEASIADDSSHYEVWENLLMALQLSDNDTKHLANMASRAENLFPMHPLPSYIAATVFHKDKEYDKAKKRLKRCLLNISGQSYLENAAYALLADCCYWMEEYDEAWQYYERCIQFDPDDYYTLNNYAYFLSLQETRLEKAEQMSKITIEAMPDEPSFLDTYAWILHIMGRDEEALPYMQHAIEVAGEETDTYRNHLKQIQQSIKNK